MKRKNLKKPMISALEQRILFDGAAVATAVDVLDESSFSSNNNTQSATTSNDVTQNNAENSVHEAQAVQGFERDRREVAFVDITVKDYQTLVDGVGVGVEVYLVSSLDDINSILKSETNIDAIHILSHGNVGEITVGNDVLNQNTLNSFDAVLQTMKNSLSENGDILLYGCNVASDGTGQEFIDTLASITEADVAASDDLTGSNTLNGDWDLEVISGVIETQSLVLDEYTNTLDNDANGNFNFSPIGPGSAGTSKYLSANLAGSGTGTIKIVANDVDYDQGERNAVYFKDANDTTERFLGHLQGSNNADSTTVFNNVTFNTGGTATIRIYGEVSGWDYNVKSANFTTTGNAAPEFTSGTSATVAEDGSVNITVSGRDGMTLNDNVTLSLHSGPSHGTISGFETQSGSPTASDTFTYTPSGDYNGSDSITFKLTDGIDTVYQTININVTASNDLPYISGKETVTVNEDTSITISGLTVGDKDIGSGNLTVTIDASHGTLSLGDSTGVTTSWDAENKTFQITGTVTNLNNALATLRYQGDANWFGDDPLTITINDGQGSGEQPYRINQTGKFFNPDNGHYYEFVSSSGITWDKAKTDAEARTLYGLKGYLVTITSDSENTLITSMAGGNGWIGASDSTSEGIWKWVTGPEAGTQFWTGDTNAGTNSTSNYGSSYNGQYSNWANGEPNNSDSSRGGEDVAHFYYNGVNAGKWNDFAATNNSAIAGYIVEYGGYGGTLAAANLTVRVLSVNDLPVNNIPTARTINEDVNIVFSTTNGNVISISDNDALNDPSVILTTTLSIGSGKGTLTLSGGSGATITNNGSTTVQITGTVAQINASLEGLTYTPTLNANGTAYTTLVITTNDGIATDTDSVIINITPVDDKPVANSMAATVGVGSAQLFSYFQPNFFDVEGDSPVAIKLLSSPDKGQFEYWNGTSWEIVTINETTPLVVAMSDMNNYRFNALSESNTSTTVQWQVKTAGDTSDTGWSNTATGTISILSYADNTTPSVSITYPVGTETGTSSEEVIESPDSTNPTSSVKTVTSNNVITINEDSQTATITLTYSDSVTPAQFMQGILSSSNTRLIDFADSSTFEMTQSVTNNVGTITLILKPKANMYGETLITLGAFDGQKTTQETFILRVNSVNEQAIVDNFTRTINEDTSFSFATINPADIYLDANDVNNNANVSAVDYNSQMAIIQDAMMNPSNTDKQAAKITAIETLVEANYFPQSFIIDTLPTNGDLYLDGIKIESTNYTIAIANLEKLIYQPDLNYFGTDSFTWHALDKEGLATTIKTATFTVDAVNDAPVITSPSTIQIVDSSGASINGTINTSLVANDVDNVNLTYKIDSGTGVLVETMVGTYGTLVINSSTGDYQFIPNQTAITALDSNTTETFILNVSDGELSDTTTLTINITAAAETASTYVEQADSTLILTDTTINTEHFYGGGFIEFNLNSSTSSETLGIQKVTTPDITADTVSIVGNSVYLGNGTSANVIGQIDAVYNGENGQKLKINFSVDFANGNFNSANSSVGLLSSTTNAIVNIDGWTIVNGRVNLGVDTIAGLATPEDTTNPSRVIAAIDKDGDTLRRETYYTYINNDGGNDNSIKMNSSLTSTSGYAIVRGPYIYSDSAVSLKIGDTVQFDWKAQGGGDAYDVFGYIVDVNNPSNYQIILNQTGANASATTAWATESITVSVDGDYKFVFVSGSWDATGGKVLGAQLYIDDVKVTQANPTAGLTSDVLEKIAQKVTYQNSSDLSATNGVLNKTVTITTSSGDSTPVVHSSTKALNIQEVNDSVTLVSTVSNIYYTDTDGVDNFSNTTGKLTATDIDSGTTFTYGIDGATSNGDGTASKVGTYGTLTINSSTGEYTFVPNSNAINALSSNVTETFTFNVSDGSGSSDSKVLTINIESVNDAPLLGGVVSSPTFTENGAATLIDKTITITDLEGTSYDSGYVSFKISQNVQVEDKLSILNVGGISLSGNNVTYGGVIIGVVDSTYNGQNGKELRVNLNSNAYSSQVQALARAIAFSNPTDDLSSNARTIETKINDGGNGGATTARYSIKEAIVNIQTINDLAQINLGNESLVVEKSIFSNPNGDLNLGSMISFADLDGDTLTVVIETTNYGLINVNDSVSNGLNSSQISGNNSRVVTLTGTIEQINNTLAASNGASYTAGAGNDYITPGADYLKVTATDELGGVSISQKLVMVLPAIPNAYSDNIIAKEDNNAIVDISSLTSDINDNAGTYIFGTGSADITDVNGNITSSGNITAFEADKIVFSSYDIDGDNNPFTQSPIGYQLANGKLILDNDQILGTDFAKFTFIPNENWSGVETFVYQYTSGDGKVSNIAQISIYVTAVNDAPIVTVSNSETINEDSSIVFENTNAITLGDIDIINSNQMLDLTLSVENGKLELAQNSGLTIIEGSDNSSKIKVQGSLSDLQNAIDGLKYTSNQDYNGTDALIVKLNDNGNTGEGGILESQQTINITINAVNDAPVFTSQVDDVVEGVIINGVLPASDVDSSSLAFSIEGDAPSGFVLNSDGSYNFDSSSYNHLGAGETQTIVVPVSVTDIEGLKTTANFSITIIGSNDSPDIQIVDVNANIVEGSVLSDTGSITFTDLDLTDRAVATEATKSVTAVSQDGVTPLVLTSIQQQDIEAAFTINNVNTNTNDGIVTWDYTIAEGKLDFLGEGEIVTAVFTITVTDDEGAADTQDVIVRIIGSNDSPDIQIVDVNANIVEGSVLSDTGSITFTDLDLTDRAVATEATKSVTAVSQDGVTPLVLTSIQQQDIEAAFTINNVNTNTNDGIVTWDYTIAEGKLDFLGEGEIVTAVFTITVTDDEGAADTQDVIVRIIGSNDSPDIQIVDVNANIVEGSVLSDTGSITFTDLDLTDRAVATEATKSVTAVSQDGVTPLVLTSIQQQDIEAAFTINNVNTNTNDGIVTWDYTIAEGKLDFLGEGEIVTAVFTITVTDDEGAADTQDVIVRIIGSNDSPDIQIVDVNANIVEGSVLSDTGSITFTDLDLTDRAVATEATKSVTAVSQDGVTPLVLTSIQQQDIEAAFTINNVNTNTNDGIVTWDYTIAEGKLDFLGEGEIVTAVFTITVTDDEGAADTQDVIVRIIGSNDSPDIQIVDVNANIVEGSVLSDTGSITFTDLDLTDRAVATEATKSVTAVSQDGVTPLVLTSIQQQDIEAAFTINNVNTNTNDGIVTWDYTIAEGKLDFLGEGEIVTAVFTITVTDDEGAADTQDVIVRIIGSNDSPDIQIVDVNANIVEGSVLSDTGSITFTDLDLTDRAVATEATKSVTAVSQDGVTPLVLTSIQQQDIEAAFTINNVNTNTNDGIVTWDYTIAEGKLDFLGEGEIVTAVFTITVTDDEGAADTQDVIVRIIGSNDSPDIQIVDVNANIVEGSVLSDTGSITFTDLDLTDRAVATEATKSVTAVSQDGVTPLVLTSIQQQDIEAAFTINNVNTNTNDGIVTWDYTIAEGKLDFLGEGEIVTAVFTITVTDDEGAADTQDVIVRIIGSNDSPDIQIVDVNANIVEGSVLSDTGSITFTDLDLTDRAVATEATKSVTAVSQDGVTPLVLTSIQQQDIEAAFTINNVNTNTNDGIVTWDYTIAEGKLDFLGEGEIVTAVFTITVTDDEGAADTQDVIVRIIGSNDSPDIQIVDVNANIVEGSVLSDTGSITFTDLDLTDRAVATEATKSVTAVSQDGVTPLVLTSIQQQDIEAAFTINNVNTNTNDGIVTWDYTIAEGKLDFLGEGEIVTAVFTITVTDDEGAADTQDVIVRIIGSNDSPDIQIVDVNANIVEGSVLSDTGSITFTDLDLTDRAVATEATKSVTAVSQDGVTPLVLTSIQQQDIEAAFTINNVNTNTNDGIVTWDYTIAEGKLDFLGEGEIVTAVFTITVTDDEGAADTQDVIVRIIGSNDSPDIQIVDVNANIVEGSVLSDTGSITFTDLDLTDRAVATEATKSVTAVSQDGVTPLVLTSIQQQDIEAAFTINNVNTNTNDGIVTWDYTIAEGKLDFLGEGEIVTAVFTITVTDDEGAADTQDVIVRIIGSNDSPIVSFENVNDSTPFGEAFTKNIASLFSDKDLTNVFTYEAINLPRGLVIDSKTGVISGAAIESGIFEITLIGKDSGNPSLSVSRTFSLLVIAPAQAETITVPTSSDTADTNSNTNNDITLNNFNDNGQNNIGVLNTNSSDLASSDTGVGFLSNTSNTNDGIVQNNELANNQTEEVTSNNTTITNSTNQATDSKGLVQANVDLNVLTNGQIVFNETNQDSFSIVGITIEEIRFENNNIEIKVVDTNLSQNFIVTQIDGSALPQGLSFNPRTGNIIGIIPEDLEKLEISIKAINQDGTTRVLNLKLDLKELKKSQANQADADEKYMGLKEQIALENQKLGDYGSYLTRLFA